MMDDTDIDLAMRQPWVSIGTDAAALDTTLEPQAAARGIPALMALSRASSPNTSRPEAC